MEVPLGLKQRAISPLTISNSISSLIKGKSNTGNSRLNKLGASLNLAPNREELITTMSDRVQEMFIQS